VNRETYVLLLGMMMIGCKTYSGNRPVNSSESIDDLLRSGDAQCGKVIWLQGAVTQSGSFPDEHNIPPSIYVLEENGNSITVVASKQLGLPKVGDKLHVAGSVICVRRHSSEGTDYKMLDEQSRKPGKK
jgi:hypothetical protein